MSYLHRFFTAVWYQLPRVFLLIIAFYGLLLFTGFFGEAYTAGQRIFILSLVVLYCAAPFVMRSVGVLKPYIADQRSSFLLGLAGMFFIFTTAEALSFGLSSTPGLLSLLVGSAVLIFVTSLVIRSTGETPGIVQ
ncbi:MAG: hypothetical protein LAT84_04890 [Balneolia bacterium]|nr:hypothetical protein [Balneolia bacterium]